MPVTGSRQKIIRAIFVVGALSTHEKEIYNRMSGFDSENRL